MTDHPTVAPPRIAVLTISDAGARGERADTSGDRIVEWVGTHGWQLAGRMLVPDDTLEIVRALLVLSDAGTVDVVLTTGGTGLTPRDVTPEATRAAIDREAPGIAEAIRARALPGFPRAALSRGLAGVRGHTLIVNLPGSPGGVSDGLAVLEQWMEHAVNLVRGERTDHEGSGFRGQGTGSPFPLNPEP